MTIGVGMPERLRQLQETVTLGQLAGAGILSTGRIFFVKDSDDGDIAEFRSNIPATRRFTSIAAAVAKLRSGMNDYVFICPTVDATAWALTADVNLLGRNMHLLGVAMGAHKPQIEFTGAYCIDIGNGALTGDRTKGIEIGNLHVTLAALDTSGVTCIQVGDSNTFTADTWIHDCKLVNQATTAAKAEIQDYGSDLLVERCTIGRAATSHCVDNYLQLPGAGAAVFNDCIFLHYAAAEEDQFATIVATGLPAIFRNCLFHNGNLGSVTMTTGIVSEGMALLDQCLMTGAGYACTTAKGYVAPWVWNAGTGADQGANIFLGGDGALGPPQT